MSFTPRCSIAFLCTLLATPYLPGGAFAQWSDSPALNLQIAGGVGEQTQPKLGIVNASDYIVWFSNSGGGYDVYLQRLDALGNKLWAPGGVLIADRSFSSTQDYGFDVDPAGNALITFRDDRSGSVQITATKVSPDGVQLWGPTGVQLTKTTDFVAAPKIAGLSDGSIAIAWKQNNDVKLARLDADGEPVWDTMIVDIEGTGTAVSDLHESGDGTVILSMVTGFLGANHIYAQKYNANGTTAWGNDPIAVFDGGSLQTANFPPFITDNAGGAVFAWYQVSPLQCRVQRILSNGTEQFAHNGVTVSTNAAQIRVSPSASFDGATGDIYVAWTEESSNQAMDGVYAQRITSRGDRAWGDSGRVIVPLGATEHTQVRTLPAEDGMMAYWVETLAVGNQRIFGARLNAEGEHQWPGDIIDISTVASSKSRLIAQRVPAGSAHLVWADGRNDANDIYGQSVRPDGAVGNLPGDVDGDKDVDFDDFTQLLASWGDPGCGGPPGVPCPADLDGDGDVDFDDFTLLLANWSS